MRIIKDSFLLLIAAIGVYLIVFSILYFVWVGNGPLIYRTSYVLNWKGGATYQSFQEFNQNKKYDFIILGSSHAYRGYNPQNFEKAGWETFNLGTSSQSLSNSYFVAKHYLDSTNVRTVILDVFEGPFVNDGLESTSNLIENIPSNKAAIEIAWAQKDARTINMLTLRMLSSGSDPLYLDSSYVYNGFCTIPDSAGTDFKYNPFRFDPLDKQVQYLDKLLAYFKEAGVDVIAVNHPQPPRMIKQSHPDFLKTVGPIFKKYNVPFLDYSFDKDVIPAFHYYDHTHLNAAGVEIFNEKLISDLKAMEL